MDGLHTVLHNSRAHDPRVQVAPFSLVSHLSRDQCRQPHNARISIMGMPDLDALSEKMEIMRWRFNSAWCSNEASKGSCTRCVVHMQRVSDEQHSSMQGFVTTPFAYLYNICKRVDGSTQMSALTLVVANHRISKTSIFGAERRISNFARAR